MFNTKFFIVFSFVLFMALGYKTYEQYKGIDNTHRLMVLNESKSLAHFIVAFRKTYQKAFIDNEIVMDHKMINLLPVKTISEISDRFSTQVQTNIVIRTVSDRPRNIKNKANNFEMSMIDYFRKNPKEIDKFIEKDNYFYYTKPMLIEASCLACHGKRENTIPSIRDKYTTAYDYKVGEIRGLLNIKIKDKGFFAVLHSNFIDTLMMTILLYGMFLIIIYMLIRKMREKEDLYTHSLESEINEKTLEIQKQKNTFETLFEKSSDGILIIEKGNFVQCNEMAVKMLCCHSKEEVLDLHPSELSPEFQPDGRSSHEKSEEMMQLALQNDGNQFEWVHKRFNGEDFWVEVNLTPITLNDSNVIHVIWRDISEKKMAQKKLMEQKDILYHQAHHDPLTGLPNRTLFNKRLERGIKKAKAKEGYLALLFIDLDQFKQINDSLGHDIGDRVLRVVAERLQAKIRKKDTLARLGGDEFTIIIENYKSITMLSKLAQSILKVLIQPIHIEGQTLYTSSSIGISLYPEDDSSAENLLKYADAAMYKAKDEGRNNYQFYRTEMTEHAFESIVMRAGLRQALENNEFLVYYQPQIDAVSGELKGLEALVRWEHPTLGLLLPSKFLSLAEESGIIVEIDRWVMQTAMLQVNAWYKQGFQPGILALNLSLTHLRREDYIKTLSSTIDEIYFRSEWLELEITESEVMKTFDEVITKLKLIKSLGIGIAIDDFGTGHSSLSYLKKLPVHKLKIDKSFIDDVPGKEEDVAIIKAIIALATNLNLIVLAEGVETEIQKDFLLENGCSCIQGYYYAAPMSNEEIEEKYFLKNTQ